MVGMPSMSAQTSFGIEPPTHGSSAGTLPVVRWIDATAHWTAGIRIEPGGLPHHAAARLLHLDGGETVGIEMAPQRGNEARGIVVDGEADLAMRARPRRHRVDRIVGIAGDVGQHLKRAPPENLFGRAQSWLAPP
jgi:hypothetical protein